ncbi:phosphate ABC transporter substrate-binding protein, partial [Synechococcus sp. OH2]
MTAQSSGPPPIVYILLLAILGGGGWYAYRSGLFDSFLNRGNVPSVPSQIPAAQPQAPTAPNLPQAQAPNLPAGPVKLDTSLPNPAVLQMDGSVTMVRLVLALKSGYSQRNPGIPLTYGI